MQAITYEGYAPGGIAVLVEAMTDNRNRTAADVRYAFSHHGGNLGTDGSVSYLFRKRGILLFRPGTDEGRVMEVALAAGAEDLQSDEDGSLSVYASPENFDVVRKSLATQGLLADDAEVTMVPTIYAACAGEVAERGMKLLEALEELDDVQNVFHNGEFPEEMLARAG